MRTACSLIVIPRSRSRSIVSRTWSCISRWLIEPVCSSRRSASVDLPWSMWAMMQKFRTSACFVVTAMSARIPNVAVVLAIGAVLFLAGFALLLNLFGAGDYAIRRVTSRYLGTLPPGFAASKRGFRIYAILVLAVGGLCLGLAATEWLLPLGAGLLGVRAITVGGGSMVASAGEGETARGNKRKG